jgi:hypothetical protein
MTIDERLERLAERHEALTQTVELMLHQQREWREEIHDWQTKADERQRKNEVLLAQVLESIDTLARIAHLHERRISDLEERRD